MRRSVAILLMLLVPFQFAWSATQLLHGHLDDNVSVMGFHSHGSDGDHHGDSKHAAHPEFLAGSASSSDGEDGHSDGHYHPIFTSIAVDAELTSAESAPSGPPATLVSRVPPLLD